MRRELRYGYNEDTRVLRADIENIKTIDELSQAINELESLEFYIDQISLGDIIAYKQATNVRDILDPKYKKYRITARTCEE